MIPDPVEKACPIVLHPDGAPVRLLWFQHPLAGAQLVKGGVEPEETPLRAARRELWEEAGLVAGSGMMLGISDAVVPGERWHFALLRVPPPVRDSWAHTTGDGGGLRFVCGWMALNAEAPFEGRFARAWTWIRAALS